MGFTVNSAKELVLKWTGSDKVSITAGQTFQQAAGQSLPVDENGYAVFGAGLVRRRVA
jgi:hypothetical protein